MLVGGVWSEWLPLNRQLWAPSFVFWPGGASFILLGLAHALIDRLGWPPVDRSLGINAITAYAGSWLAVWGCFRVWPNRNGFR